MAELRIRTARNTLRIAAPPKRVFQLVAHVDRWPEMVDSLVAVEHVGFAGTCERVRFWHRIDGELRGWTSARELNPKRLQVRFRREDVAYPYDSLGGLWLVAPKGDGSMVVLDHYYRVVDDNDDAAARIEREVSDTSTVLLAALRQAAEFGGKSPAWPSFLDKLKLPDNAKGAA